MTDPDTWHGLPESPHARLYASLIPDAYRPLMEQALRDGLAADEFARRLGIERKPPTRRQRLARWWDRNLPRIHRGPCNHDDCWD